MRLKVKIIRAGHLAPNVRNLHLRLIPRLDRAIKESSEKLLEVSNENCPKDTMALHDSGHVRKEKSGLEVEYIVGYGGYDFDASAYGKDRVRRPPYFYAFWVHQMQVPFLSNAVVQARDDMKRIIREAMQKQSSK